MHVTGAQWEERAAGNVRGVARALTTMAPMKPWKVVLLRLAFWLRRNVPPSRALKARPLLRLSFIHFARWALVRRIPYNGPPQRKEKLRYPHLFFESNFNGSWDEYIDAFSHVLTRGMTTFWGSSYGFPKPLPTAPFKRYIKGNEIEASHFYSAYPEATSTMIQAALRLDGRLAPLKANAARMDPDEFAAEYRRLLTDAQDCL